MKKIFVIALLVSLFAACTPKYNNNYIWMEGTGNYRVFSTPDSIEFYLSKVKDMGFDNVILDVRAVTGEVLYQSDIAPYLGEWKGVTRPADYDIMGKFIEYGHSIGLRVFASHNFFVGGFKALKRGIVYTDHPEWQTVCYDHGKVAPINEVKRGFASMLNPSNPEVQQYMIDILKEFLEKYPDIDGFIFDRVRYDGITADFSDLSRSQFEARIGHEVENFPESVISWYDENGKLRDNLVRGKYYNEWCEYRAGVIHDFVQRAHSELKAIKPSLILGDYTGAWYPTYQELGVNWASKDYDPSVDFDWATPTYKNTGYAELLDVYMTGLYYSYITKAEIDEATGVKGANGESGLNLELKYCYSVEGGAELANTITRGVVPVIGSVYVEQYAPDYTKLGPAIEQCIKDTEGVMLFDICHLMKHGLWDDVERAMKKK